MTDYISKKIWLDVVPVGIAVHFHRPKALELLLVYLSIFCLVVVLIFYVVHVFNQVEVQERSSRIHSQVKQLTAEIKKHEVILALQPITLWEDVVALASKTGLTVQSVTQNVANNADLKLKLHGSFQQWVEFRSGLARMEVFVVDEFARPQSVNEGHALEIVGTYRLLTELGQGSSLSPSSASLGF